MNHLSIRALEDFPLINPGDNLSSIILDSIEDNDINIDDGDVILLAQKIISKSEDRFKNLSKIGYVIKKTENSKNRKFNNYIVKAFQRRFRQELVTGKVDKECLIISNNLAKKFS